MCSTKMALLVCFIIPIDLFSMSHQLSNFSDASLKQMEMVAAAHGIEMIVYLNTKTQDGPHVKIVTVTSNQSSAQEKIIR